MYPLAQLLPHTYLFGREACKQRLNFKEHSRVWPSTDFKFSTTQKQNTPKNFIELEASIEAG